jgi:hypothetical protein
MTCRNLRQCLRDHESREGEGAKFAYRCVLRSDAAFGLEIAQKFSRLGVADPGTDQGCPFGPVERERCPYYSP